MKKLTDKTLDVKPPAVNEDSPEYMERVMAEARAAQARLEQQRRGLAIEGFEQVGQTARRTRPLKGEHGEHDNRQTKR